MGGGEALAVGRRQGEVRRVGEVQRDPAVVARQAPVTGPDDLAGRDEGVEHARGVVGDPRGQDERLERGGRQAHPSELLDDAHETVLATHRRPDPLPRGHEDGELLRGDRLDLVAQRGQRAAPQQPQHLGVAEVAPATPAELGRTQVALDDPPGLHEPAQPVAGDGGADPEPGRRLGRGEGGVRPGVAGQEVSERVGDRLEEDLGHPDGQRHAEGVAQPPGVLDDGPPLLAGDLHGDDLPAGPQLLEGGAHGGLVELVDRARHEVVDGDRAEGAHEVGHVLAVTGAAALGEALQLALGALDRLDVEQVRERELLALPEQVGEQGRVEGERGRPTLGERGVALVEELRDVAEHQRRGEGGGTRALELDEGDLAAVDALHETHETRHVVDVLEHLAHGLEDDREARVAAGHLEQRGGPLALLPQRLAPVGPAPGEQQGAGGALAEARGEEGRAAHLLGDDGQDHRRLDGDEVEQLGADGRAVVELEVRQAQHDPVVAVHRLDLDPEALAHPGGDGQRPRRVHLPAEGGEHRDPPVADLVAEALDDDRAVVGDVPGRRALLAEVGQEVLDRPGVEPGGAEPLAGGLGGEGDELTHRRAEGFAELGRPAELVAVPEGELARLPRRRAHEHPVVGDVLDPPRRRAEGEDVADPRLVDHLLVELADAAARALAGGEEDPEEPAVGDRATARHGEALGAPPAGEGAGDAVPDDARAQLGEVLGGVGAGEHVEGRGEDGVGQRGEGGGPPHERTEVLDRPVVERAHGDDLLGEHVERVGGHGDGLDRPLTHALDDDGRLDEVAAELRHDDAVAHRADLVTGAPDPLQAGRHRRR